MAMNIGSGFPRKPFVLYGSGTGIGEIFIIGSEADFYYVEEKE